jgi:hypothetical protein
MANELETIWKMADMAFEGETVIMIAGWRMPQECLWDYFPMASLSFCSPSTCASMVTSSDFVNYYFLFSGVS